MILTFIVPDRSKCRCSLLDWNYLVWMQCSFNETQLTCFYAVVYPPYEWMAYSSRIPTGISNKQHATSTYGKVAEYITSFCIAWRKTLLYRTCPLSISHTLQNCCSSISSTFKKWCCLHSSFLSLSMMSGLSPNAHNFVMDRPGLLILKKQWAWKWRKDPESRTAPPREVLTKQKKSDLRPADEGQRGSTSSSLPDHRIFLLVLRNREIQDPLV